MTGSIAAISYATAAAAFLVISILLGTRWRGRRFGPGLQLACLMSAAWAGLIVVRLFAAPSLFIPVDLVELARNASWTWFLLTLEAPGDRPAGTQSSIRSCSSACMPSSQR